MISSLVFMVILKIQIGFIQKVLSFIDPIEFTVIMIYRASNLYTD